MTPLQKLDHAFRHLQYLATQSKRIERDAAVTRAEVYAAIGELKSLEPQTNTPEPAPCEEPK